jgi:hypothetical protein
MPDMTVAVIKEEIARLERELDLHRRALQVLEGTKGGRATKPTRPAVQPPKQAPKRVAAKARPSKPLSKPVAPSAAREAQPSARTLIQEYLKSHASQMFTPSEIAQGISQRGTKVDRDNVQRRLSDMIKAKLIVRKDGRYGIPK